MISCRLNQLGCRGCSGVAQGFLTGHVGNLDIEIQTQPCKSYDQIVIRLAERGQDARPLFQSLIALGQEPALRESHIVYRIPLDKVNVVRYVVEYARVARLFPSRPAGSGKRLEALARGL